jgi:hypothetical protein
MIDVLLIGKRSEEDRVVVEITQGNLKLIAKNIYLHARNEISMDLNKTKHTAICQRERNACGYGQQCTVKNIAQCIG